MTKEHEVWTQADASACERAGDTITLVDMIDDRGNTVDRFTVDVHDVVELPDFGSVESAESATTFDVFTGYENLPALSLQVNRDRRRTDEETGAVDESRRVFRALGAVVISALAAFLMLRRRRQAGHPPR